MAETAKIFPRNRAIKLSPLDWGVISPARNLTRGGPKNLTNGLLVSIRLREERLLVRRQRGENRKVVDRRLARDRTRAPARLFLADWRGRRRRIHAFVGRQAEDEIAIRSGAQVASSNRSAWNWRRCRSVRGHGLRPPHDWLGFQDSCGFFRCGRDIVDRNILLHVVLAHFVAMSG